MKKILVLILTLALSISLFGCVQKKDNEVQRYDLYSAVDETITETVTDGGGGFLLVAAWFHYDSSTTQLYESTFWAIREDGGVVRFTLKEGGFDMQTIIVFPTLEDSVSPYIEIECRNTCSNKNFSTRYFKYDVEEIRVYIPQNAFVNPDILLDD